jgi:hypothetical protein
MAINVNTVYKTVLLILNQQQRGYMTPDEFNKVATQVQLNIFELKQILLSPLTQPTTNFPIYLYENDKLYVYPTSIKTPTDVTFSYLKTPADVVWGYGVGTLGQFEYNQAASTNFELSVSEQSNVITRVLAYAGVIINDPTIIQVAAQEIATEEQNSKI